MSSRKIKSVRLKNTKKKKGTFMVAHASKIGSYVESDWAEEHGFTSLKKAIYFADSKRASLIYFYTSETEYRLIYVSGRGKEICPDNMGLDEKYIITKNS